MSEIIQKILKDELFVFDYMHNHEKFSNTQKNKTKINTYFGH